MVARCGARLVRRTPVTVFTYLGTEHSFANASVPATLDTRAAALAFARTASFLARHLGD
jgi:carboxymethylenebutenolidase